MMSLSSIDKNAALIVIDLQKGLAGLPSVRPMQAVVANASQLAAALLDSRQA